MISSKTSVSFGGARNIESDSGLSKKGSALQFVMSLILPARVGPIMQKKIIKFVGDNGRFPRNHVIYFKEEGGSRFKSHNSVGSLLGWAA